MPAAALGAPQTICNGVGAAGVDSAHAQAVGVRMRLDSVDLADDDAVNGGAAGAASSTSSPAIVSGCTELAVSSGGSHSVRSQRSENFMVGAPSRELPQEAQVVLVEQRAGR